MLLTPSAGNDNFTVVLNVKDCSFSRLDQRTFTIIIKILVKTLKINGSIGYFTCKTFNTKINS